MLEMRACFQLGAEKIKAQKFVTTSAFVRCPFFHVHFSKYNRVLTVLTKL